MLLIYSPDDSNIYGSRGGEFEGAERCKVVFLGATSYSPVQTVLL